ncbi:antigen WC1.1 isoform X2 [Gallus gallus]|uniref:antigen WC1.1 isoform X2 n=1 Tax=Gallus gallus TaxID=9031 RepID=UPI001AEAD32E|nr:antigen WC1.1 isoform X2 [Gallus gallus]
MLQARVEEPHLMRCIASVQVERQLHVVGVDSRYPCQGKRPLVPVLQGGHGAACAQMQAVMLCPTGCCMGPLMALLGPYTLMVYILASTGTLLTPLLPMEAQRQLQDPTVSGEPPGVWARVSVGLWDNGTATVVCRQLGCGVPEKIHAAPANGSGLIELQELRCVGTEELLAQCNATRMAAEPSKNPEELAIACSGSKQLRLVGGRGRCAGRVEVYSEGTWGTICQDSWTLQDATVVCRQLGCGRALEAPGSERFGPGTGTLWLGAGGCAGTEDALWHCPAPVQRGCRHGGGAGAVCSGLLDLRLMGGSSRCSGHLEVLHEGTWGRVCANGTSPATASAVCLQLGCGTAGSLTDNPAEGSKPAWLSWVRCEEGARSLWRCPSAPWQLQECGPTGITHITCDEDSRDSSEATSPAPALTHSAVPLTAAPRRVSALTVLCVLLGTLLCVALAALAVQAHRTQSKCQGGHHYGGPPTRGSTVGTSGTRVPCMLPCRSQQGCCLRGCV